jgi:hypothetical protein
MYVPARCGPRDPRNEPLVGIDARLALAIGPLWPFRYEDEVWSCGPTREARDDALSYLLIPSSSYKTYLISVIEDAGAEFNLEQLMVGDK